MASNSKQGGSAPIARWVTAAVVVLLAVYAVHSLTRQRISVHTAQVSYRSVIKSVTTNGKVELTDDFQPRAQAQGRVEAIYVSPEQRVHAGQLLLKLNDAAAQATLTHAQAALQSAELAAANVSHGGSPEEHAATDADLDRFTLQLQQDGANLVVTQRLLSQGASSQAEVDAAQHRVQMDETNLQALHSRSSQRYTPADVSSATAQVADARASVAAAESALADDLIKSPIAGTVYDLPVTRYAYVQANDELIDVADLNRLRVQAYFDEPDIGSLAVGQPVTIIWEAKPGMTWHGHISQLPSDIKGYQNRFVGECVVTVDDANGVLTANANVNLTVTLAVHPHVLAVPREAVKFDHGRPYVFRVFDGRLVRTNVRIGLDNLTYMEIVSGLSEGEAVATNATTNVELIDGESVSTVSGP